MRRRIAKIFLSMCVALTLTSPLTYAASIPAVLRAPTITISSDAKIVTAVPAKWSVPVKSVFQWLINGKSITGKKLTINLPSNFAGGTVKFMESVKSASGKTISTSSNLLQVTSISLVGDTHIDFTDQTKSILSATLPNVLSGHPVISYQWFRGPFEIPGATSPTYVITSADEKTDLSLEVTYSAKGSSPIKKDSQSITIAVKPRTYSLIWSDEFNSTTGSPIDSSVWVPQNGDGVAFDNKGWGNKERQWYVDSQSAIDSTGALVTTATRTGASAYNCYYKAPCEWISSKFVTKGKIGFKYGRIEARIKGPVGNGSWAAFWMLGANIDTRPWPGSGEIDVTELLGRTPNTVYGTLHGPLSGGGGRGGTTDLSSGFSSDYHTYAVDWLPDQITWYVDGTAYASVNKTDNDWVFDHEFYLIINLAMGGIFGGDVDPNLTTASQSVDYVRVFSINGVGEVIKH